jgi:hypothetical protein
MTGYSRRTHIVRISDAKPGDPPSDTYIDVEVLDAIAFQTGRGEEVVLHIDNSDPYIVDDTGGGHDKSPDEPTQRTHMKRVTSKTDPTQKLDIEVMDILAFQDQRGEEWILDAQALPGVSNAVFNTTDGSGDSFATRRVHDEKIADPFGEKDPTSYLTSQRCDAVAFRGAKGKEVVFACPSNDDPNSSDPRASTYVWSPVGYDPTDESDRAVKPPSLSDSGDKHNYLNFVKDAGGFLTGDEKIQMGPFWWIRKVVNGGAGLMVIGLRTSSIDATGAPPRPFPFTKFAYDSDAYDVMTLDQALINPQATQPATVNPPSSAMLGASYMFTIGPPTVFVSNQDWGGISATQTDTYRELVFNIAAIKAQLPPGATTLTISAVAPIVTGYMTAASPHGPYLQGSIVTGHDVSSVYATSADGAIAEATREYMTIPGMISVANAVAYPAGPLWPTLWTVAADITQQNLIGVSFFWQATGYTYRSKNIDRKQALTFTGGSSGVCSDQVTGRVAPLDKWTGASSEVMWSSPPFVPALSLGQSVQPAAGFSWTIDLKTLKFISPADDGSAFPPAWPSDPNAPAQATP